MLPKIIAVLQVLLCRKLLINVFKSTKNFLSNNFGEHTYFRSFQVGGSTMSLFVAISYLRVALCDEPYTLQCDVAKLRHFHTCRMYLGCSRDKTEHL